MTETISMDWNFTSITELPKKSVTTKTSDKPFTYELTYSPTEDACLRTRWEHGSCPVLKRDHEIVVLSDEGEHVYQSERQALQAVTGNPNPVSWPIYFRLGKYQTPTDRTSPTIAAWDLFPAITIEDSTSGAIIVHKYSQTHIGIDLQKRGHEVKKLLFAGFGYKIQRAGYDPEDVLQEVFKGILVRNKGKCPFDPKKASFGHYVHMVCECVISNYHRRMTRQRRVEPAPADEYDEQAIDRIEGGPSPETEELLAADLAGALEDSDTPWGNMGTSLLTKVLPYVRAGYGRSEIAELLSLPKPVVSKVLADLRKETRTWAR